MTESKISTQLIEQLIEAIQDRKGLNITHIDMSHIETAASPHFIICEGTSSMHVASIADHVREYMLENYQIKPFNYDGYRAAQWIVIDYGDTLVHVFTRDARELYNLEELWSDAEITEYPDIF
ncbi:MAG: ribosome silencing factor [Muribaculaceae bacterium]|nr:ribosome silencing factor [Muribaculaceae bacterium]